jgi:site-specific recombinase XerD
MLGYVGPAEIDAILDATGSDWTGRRDHLLFLLLYNTGARVSEIISLRVRDLVSSNHKQVQILGKGRKRRTIPLWRKTRTEVREWIKANKLGPDDPLLPNRWHDVLTRSGVAKQMKKAVVRASSHCLGLKGKTVSPHTFRHSIAMHMLESGVAVEVIALWLGHESPTTTHGYVEASLSMKKQALERLKSPQSKRKRFVPSDALLSFLENL